MSMSRNSSVNSLMGFSVHQPAIGAPLQFFPAMGSKQLDEMIEAYIPGDASILNKRAAVSMEFFEYTMATGEPFKFFMVYPTLDSARTSPHMAAAYSPGFTTSPVTSESQWETSSYMASPPSSSKAATANDFSNIPGMKIMTKDGRDVTNSASRGCKTKEQRDHAHLMRIIKACDSCRRKKTKCDPSHKRPSAGVSSSKVTKKAKSARPAAAPPQTASKQAPITPELSHFSAESLMPLEPIFTDSLNAAADTLSVEWEQFIQYEEEPTASIPYDYDFFLDPAGYFSPTMTESFSSSSTSPSQLPITPIDRDVHLTDPVRDGHNHKPLLPYLNDGGVESGDGYLDFNLFSPGSSILDEDIGFATELAASPIKSGADQARVSCRSVPQAEYDGLPGEAPGLLGHHSSPNVDAANAERQSSSAATLESVAHVSSVTLAGSDRLPLALQVQGRDTRAIPHSSEGACTTQGAPHDMSPSQSRSSNIVNCRPGTGTSVYDSHYGEDGSEACVTRSTSRQECAPVELSSAVRRVTAVTNGSEGAERGVEAPENIGKPTYSTTPAPGPVARVPCPPMRPESAVQQLPPHSAVTQGSLADALALPTHPTHKHWTADPVRQDKESGLQHQSALQTALSTVESGLVQTHTAYDGGLYATLCPHASHFALAMCTTAALSFCAASMWTFLCPISLALIAVCLRLVQFSVGNYGAQQLHHVTPSRQTDVRPIARAPTPTPTYAISTHDKKITASWKTLSSRPTLSQHRHDSLAMKLRCWTRRDSGLSWGQRSSSYLRSSAMIPLI